MFNIETLQSKSDQELTKLSKDLGVKLDKKNTPEQTVFAILDFQASNPNIVKDYLNANPEPMSTKSEEPTPEKKPAAKRTKKPVAKPKEIITEAVAKTVEEVVTEETAKQEVVEESTTTAPKKKKS